MPRSRGRGRGGGRKTNPSTSGPPPKHGEPGYKPEKDFANVGFQLGGYGGTTDWLLRDLEKKFRSDIDAYDFYTDKTTGFRPGQKSKPNGGMVARLDEDGVDSTTVLPPAKIWREGRYLSELLADDDFLTDPNGFDELPFLVKKVGNEVLDEIPSPGNDNGKVPDKIFNIFIVSGEGTPGNNIWRAYYLPQDVAKQPEPKHPLMWTVEQKKGSKTKSWPGGYDYGRAEPLGTQTPTKPTAPPKPRIPSTVRMRCDGCGHWFKMDDLTDHIKVGICPGTGEIDWAMMCDPACGCQTLDQVSTCKPGFPRPKKKEASEENGSGDSVALTTPVSEA